MTKTQECMKLPKVLLWFPELRAEFSDMIVLRCPECHAQKCRLKCVYNEHHESKEIKWKKVCGDHDYYIVVYKTYRCAHGHAISTIDEGVRALLPPRLRVSFPAVGLYSKSRVGLDKHTFRRMLAECTHGMSVQKFRDILIELHAQHWLDKEEIYWDRFEGGTKKWEAFKDGITRHGILPSLKMLRRLLHTEQARTLESHHFHMSTQGPGREGIFCGDGSYKTIKPMRLKGISCAKTCYTVMSGDGRVLGQWFLRSEDTISGSDWDTTMQGLCRRFEVHGFKPRLYYTDNYRKEYNFMTRIFPWLSHECQHRQQHQQCEQKPQDQQQQQHQCRC